MNQTINQEKENSEEAKIDYKKNLLKYLKYWPWYILSIIIALGLAHFKLRYTPNTYTTSTSIRILTKEESSAISDLTSLNSLNGSKVNIENEIHILKSYRMIEKVVKDQNLTQRFYHIGTLKETQIESPPFELIISDKIVEPTGNYLVSFNKAGFEIINESNEKKSSFKGMTTEGTVHNFPFEIRLPSSKKDLLMNPIRISLSTVKSATLSLQNKVQVSYLGKSTDLLKISMTGTLRSKSENILNSLVRIYGEEGVEDKRLVDKRTVDFIDQRFITLAKELDTIEVYKKEFKQNNKLFNIEDNALMEIEKESQTEEALFEMENQLLISKMLQESLANGKRKDLLPNNLGLQDNSINNLVEKYNQLIISRNRLLKSGGVNNPSVIILEERLQTSYKVIKKSIEDYIAQLNQSLVNLKNRNSKFRKTVASLPLKEKLFREIERKQEIKESLFILLLEKRETSAIKYAIKEPVIKVVDYALTKMYPTGPNRKSFYLGAFISGLLLPLIIVYLKITLNTKITLSNDIEAIVKSAPVLGTIPLLKDDKRNLSDEEGARSFLKEAFRTLLTNVKFMIPNENGRLGKTILVTSSIKGEGKTLVSYNLASEVSNHKGKVVLIGADLRNPQLHKYLDVSNVNIGLSSYLNDDNIKVSDLEFYHPNETTNLDILFAGAIPPNPTSLLSNNRFEELLDILKKTYDYIIIDSAPTLLVSDTLIFGKLVDTTVYVARSNYTEKNIVEYSKRLVDEKKLNNVGYVLNGVDKSNGYGYNYNYAYSYSYTYDDDEQNKKWYHFFKR